MYACVPACMCTLYTRIPLRADRACEQVILVSNNACSFYPVVSFLIEHRTVLLINRPPPSLSLSLSLFAFALSDTINVNYFPRISCTGSCHSSAAHNASVISFCPLNCAFSVKEPLAYARSNGESVCVIHPLRRAVPICVRRLDESIPFEPFK